jgi:hypothetical protein
MFLLFVCVLAMAGTRGKAMLEAALKKGKINAAIGNKDEKRKDLKRKGVYKIFSYILFITFNHNRTRTHVNTKKRDISTWAICNR